MAYCRNMFIVNTINTDPAINMPIIDDNDNLKSALDMSLKYSWVL